jgi:hypothetical protein
MQVKHVKHRFAKDLENPTRQLTKARGAAKTLKAKGGLPYARSASKLGCILFDDQNYNEAEPLFKEALEIRKSTPASSASDRGAAKASRRISRMAADELPPTPTCEV